MAQNRHISRILSVGWDAILADHSHWSLDRVSSSFPRGNWILALYLVCLKLSETIFVTILFRLGIKMDSNLFLLSAAYSITFWVGWMWVTFFFYVDNTDSWFYLALRTSYRKVTVHFRANQFESQPKRRFWTDMSRVWSQKGLLLALFVFHYTTSISYWFLQSNSTKYVECYDCFNLICIGSMQNWLLVMLMNAIILIWNVSLLDSPCKLIQ